MSTYPQRAHQGVANLPQNDTSPPQETQPSVARLSPDQPDNRSSSALSYEELLQNLKSRIDELEGLKRVSGELNSTLDLNKILGIVLEEAKRVTQVEAGNIYLYHASTETLVAYQEHGRPDSAQTQNRNTVLKPQPISAKEGIIGDVLHTKKAILRPDPLTNEESISAESDTSSEVAVPICQGEEPIGVISLRSDQLNFFNNSQLRYLEALASQAAVAINNAQAYQQQWVEREQANRRADQLSRLSEISHAFHTNRPLFDVLEDIAYAIVESVGYDVVLISLVSGNPPMIHHEVGAGIPIALLQELQTPAYAKPLTNLQEIMLEQFRLSNSYFIPSEQKTRWQDKLNIPYIEKSRPLAQLQSRTEAIFLGDMLQEKHLWQSGDLLFVPLTDSNDTIIGLLTVESPVTHQRPNLSSVQILEIFANHAAAAIENARLFEREMQRRHLADTLRGVAETISSQLEFDDLLNIVLQELAHVVDYDRATVQLLKEDQLVIIGGRGWEDSRKIVGISFSMEGDNPNRLVIETQEPVIVKDAYKEYPTSFSGLPDHRNRSWLGVPLSYGTNILGLMSLDKYELNFFTQEDAEVVLAFANQVAVAWQNAHLFDEARQQVRQLAALTEVAQSINRPLELNKVLDLVLEAVFELVGSSKGSIWLIDSHTNTVKIADTYNVSDFLVELFNQSDIAISSEPFASVIKSGQVLTIAGRAAKDDIANYGLPFPDDVTYVPLKTEDGVIGILAIEVVIHNKNMLELVTTLADLAAVAIDNARLLADTRRRAAEMQRLYNLGVEVSGMLEVRQVMHSVISNALALTDSQVGAILFWDEEIKRYIIEGTAITEELRDRLGLTRVEWVEIQPSREDPVSLWSDLTRRIIDTGQSMITIFSQEQQPGVPGQVEGTVEDHETERIAGNFGLGAILGVPIQVQNQINGAIFVSTLTPHNFNDRDVQSLSLVATQAAVAVRNAQLVQRLNLLTEELEQRVALRTEELAKTLQDLTEERDRVGILYQIARELSTSFDLDRVLTEALNLLNRAIGISLGAILLLDQETEDLVYRAALGRDVPLPRGGAKTNYKLGYGLAGKVMETRRGRIIPDLRVDPDWIPDEKAADHRSAIAVPLSTGDEVLGVLLLFHPEPDYFTEDQLKIVTAAGAQIATAINNAELYRLITDQAERLGVMYRRQATEAAKNQAILKGITDGVLVLDANGDIVLVNPKAAEILDIDASTVENQPLPQILGQSKSPVELELAQQLYDNLSKSLAEIKVGEYAAEFRIEAGRKAVVVTLAPVALGAEEFPSVVAVLRDISKEVEVERLKNEFISTVSHELRTPMTSVKGYTDLLLSGNVKVGELNPTQHRFVRIIQSNANRLTELVNDILEISRIETGRIKLEFSALDVIEIIREVAVSFEGQMAKKALTLSLHLPDHLPNVYADQARLTQVLVNLIGNAWQYTPEGGNINVYAKLVANFVQVDVEDNGIGIVEKDIEYVFDRFFRSERTEVQVVDGTGLGLSITQSFVEMLGGQIWVKSQVDAGTTFSFTIPLDTGHQ